MVIAYDFPDYERQEERRTVTVFGSPTVSWVVKGCCVLLSCLALASACSQESAVGPAERAAARPEVLVPAPQTATPPVVVKAAAAALPAPAPAQPASPFAVNTVLGLDYPLLPNDYVWDEEGVPDGPIGIVIDLEAQRLYVYRAGVEIGRSVIIYGDDDKPTPTGTFPILEKDIDHVSNLYDAPMPYMLRLTWDGIAIHGSGEIGYEYATHGCIGLPDEFAAILYREAGLGDNVLVTHGWMTEHYGV
jgi:lipoprotein-anchoring transpeptidase ErfK/SrfK